MGNSFCDKYDNDHMVCPPKIKHGLFTIAAVDNKDHNPSSTFFHAFIGCHQVSSFGNRGKKTAWETWSVMDNVTETFEALSAFTDQDTLTRLRPQLEWFVILLYDRSSECFEVDKARKDLFTRKGRAIENIPPSSSTLIQLTKRAVYQAGCVWGQCLLSEPQLENLNDGGWCKMR